MWQSTYFDGGLCYNGVHVIIKIKLLQCYTSSCKIMLMKCDYDFMSLFDFSIVLLFSSGRVNMVMLLALGYSQVVLVLMGNVGSQSPPWWPTSQNPHVIGPPYCSTTRWRHSSMSLDTSCMRSAPGYVNIHKVWDHIDLNLSKIKHTNSAVGH